MEKDLRYQLEDFQLNIDGRVYQNYNFTMFTFVPETPNDALQVSVQEKTRKFNNSCLYLFDFYNTLLDNIEIVNKKSWDSIENRKFRQLLGLYYKELFVYQEKIVKYVSDLLLIPNRRTGTTKKAVERIEKVGESFGFINNFVAKTIELYNNSDYRDFKDIRDDEVHNNSRIDEVLLAFKQNGTELLVVAESYRYKTEYFYNNILRTTELLINLKKQVEQFVTNENLFKIYTICKVNKNE